MKPALPVLAAIVLGMLGPSAVALAQAEVPSAAIVPFEGRRTAPIERRVAAALEGEAELAPRAAVRSAASDTGVEGTGEEGVPELAATLGVDLVVQGSVGGPRRRPTVELVVRAADGRELARGEAAEGRGRTGRAAFTDAVVEIFGRARASLPARATASASVPEEDDETPAGEDDEEEDEASSAPTPTPEDGLAIVTAVAGLAVRTRDARIDLEGGRQRRYESGAYPELGLALEVRPFANDGHLGRGLFLRGSFFHSVGLGSESADGSVQVDTNFLRFGGELGWLAPLGDVVELGVGLGVSYDGYFLSANPVLPSAEYLAIRPALRSRFRLVQETLVLEAELAYRGVLTTGPIRDAFGRDGDTHGFDVGIGLGGNLHRAASLGFAWALRFDYVGTFLSHGGVADDALATGAEESSIRVSALLGWSFR